MENFNFELVDKARETIDGRVIRTPVLPLCSSKIAPYLPPDCEMFMKLELFQHTGSFKARGALLGVDWLDEARRGRGVAGFSGGNFALALAWAARQSGVSAKVVMSKAADPLRIEGCRELGAEIVLVDGIAAALPELERIEAEEGRRILHPFNDLNMACGAATCGAEFVEDAPDLDVVILPVGGGGLICGMAASIKRHNPDVTIIGVEPVGADSLARSFKSGKPEALTQVDTLADSLGAPMAMADSLALARRYVDELVQIEDEVMTGTMLLMREKLMLLAEPACAASLGTALGPLHSRLAGKRVGVLACGSNISIERYNKYTNGIEIPAVSAA